MTNRRDRIVLWLVSWVLSYASQKTQARIRIAMIHSTGREAPESLYRIAELEHPGESNGVPEHRP